MYGPLRAAVFAVNTRGKSRMPESGTYGSVRGVPGNGHPYRKEGAHCLAQVRVADLNGELSVQRLAALAKMSPANSPHARRAA